jgi:hypothetical protein
MILTLLSFAGPLTTSFCASMIAGDFASVLNFSTPSSGDFHAPSIVDSTECDIARVFCCGVCAPAGGGGLLLTRLLLSSLFIKSLGPGMFAL